MRLRAGALNSIKLKSPLITAFISTTVLFVLNYLLYMYSGSEQLNSSIIRNIAVSAGLAFAVTAWAAFRANLTARRLERLIDAAEDLEDGDFDFDIKPVKKDALGETESAFSEFQESLFNLSKYTNQHVLDLAQKNNLNNETESRHASVAVIRLRNCRLFSNKLPAQKTARYINLFLSRLIPCITRTNGAVISFWTHDGFGLTAVWGNSYIELETNPKRDCTAACRSAVLIKAMAKKLNKDLALFEKRLGFAPRFRFSVSIGIDSGNIAIGPLGGGGIWRKEFGICGMPFKNALKASEAASKYGEDIFLTGAAAGLASYKNFYMEETKVSYENGEHFYRLLKPAISGTPSGRKNGLRRQGKDTQMTGEYIGAFV